MADGTVAFWYREAGWGGINDPERAGVGFVHFAHVRGVAGYRELFPGERVEFEAAEGGGQDGCEWSVAWVRPLDRPRDPSGSNDPG